MIKNNFVPIVRLLSKVTGKESRKELQKLKISNLIKSGLVELQEPKGFFEYDLERGFDFICYMMMLYLNSAFKNGTLSADQFVQALPPQQLVEMLMDLLQNPNIARLSKIGVINLLSKLSQVESKLTFEVGGAKGNPYFMEIAKYCQTFAELFSKFTSYHLEEKLSKPKEYWTPEREEEELSSNDIIKSQSFFSDFTSFLGFLILSRVRQVQSILPTAVLENSVKILAAPFNHDHGRYPVNLTVQNVAIKLLRACVSSL